MKKNDEKHSVDSRNDGALEDATLDAVRGAGTPLPADVATEADDALGSDPSQVRAHADGDAASAAKNMRARSFTTGSDVKLGTGGAEGDPILAREVEHAAKQSR